MENGKLIQYCFGDNSETITNQKGKVIAVREPNGAYLPLEMMVKPRVQGSIPNPLDNGSTFSSAPKVGEYLVSFRGFGLGKQYHSNTRIKSINPLERKVVGL